MKFNDLQVEQLPEKLHGVIWIFHGVSNGSGVGIDLPIIATFESLVAKEVDVFVVDPAQSLFSFNVTEAVCLIPTGRENIEGDLATDRIAASSRN